MEPLKGVGQGWGWGGQRQRERGRVGGRARAGEGWLSEGRGSELKKASRREPSVWMHSLISKKEGMKGKQGENNERVRFLLYLSIYLSMHMQYFVLSLVAISRGKTEEKCL